MTIERLSRTTFDRHHQDFAACEEFWEEMDEEKVKKIATSNHETLQLTRPDEGVSFLEWANIEHKLTDGRVVELMNVFVRKRTSLDKCPLCGSSIADGTAALSRRDNQTEICSQCARDEAINEWENTRS